MNYKEFCNKYNVAYIDYDKTTIEAIEKIINGNIDDMYDNPILYRYVGLYYNEVKKDYIIAEKYFSYINQT